VSRITSLWNSETKAQREAHFPFHQNMPIKLRISVSLWLTRSFEGGFQLAEKFIGKGLLFFVLFLEEQKKNRSEKHPLLFI